MMPELDIKIHEGIPSEVNEHKLLKFVITGNDRPGIVRELSSVIKHKGTNIVHFESSKQSAPNWGVPLFNAIATVELPDGLDKDEVIRALEDIASDVIVDVENLH
jgi:glycine cleavage system regulatory protein